MRHRCLGFGGSHLSSAGLLVLSPIKTRPGSISEVKCKPAPWPGHPTSRTHPRDDRAGAAETGPGERAVAGSERCTLGTAQMLTGRQISWVCSQHPDGSKREWTATVNQR